jgi:hypothetical protein
MKIVSAKEAGCLFEFIEEALLDRNVDITDDRVMDDVSSVVARVLINQYSYDEEDWNEVIADITHRARALAKRRVEMEGIEMKAPAVRCDPHGGRNTVTGDIEQTNETYHD